MSYGLTSDTVARIHTVFARHPEVQQAILYGSRAMGTQRDGSDIDLTLTGKDLDFKLLARIETELDDLLLPNEFDLSIRRQINNDSLLNHIERVGILFYDQTREGAGQRRASPELFSGEPVESVERGVTIKKANNSTALGEVVDLVMGQAPSSKDTNFEGRGTPFVKVGEFGPIRPVIHEWTTNPLRMARRSDVLLCVVGATCGKINLGEDCAIGRSVAAIRPHPAKLNQFYLYYFMMTLVDRLRSGSVGAAQTVISKEMAKSVQIPVPPLAEQQRIVGLLDEAFESLATAKANAEKNLRNARALFESHLQSVFTQAPLSGVEGRGREWVEKRLDTCCEQIFAGGDVPKDRLSKKRTSQYSIPIYSNGEKDDGLYGFTNVARVTKPSITVSARGTLGFTAIRTEPFLPVVRLIVLVPDEHQISLSFLYYAVVGMDFGNTGTSIPQLTVPNFRESKLLVPSLLEQRAIVEELDALAAETQRLTRIYERKLAALDALKQSLLNQAFSGEL